MTPTQQNAKIVAEVFTPAMKLIKSVTFHNKEQAMTWAESEAKRCQKLKNRRTIRLVIQDVISWRV